MTTAMTNRTTVRPIGRVLNALDNVQSNKNQYRARCPVHQKPDSKKRTLSIREESDGRVLLHCFAGCHYEDVLDEMGLTKADLFPNIPESDQWMYEQKKRVRTDRQIIEEAKPSATLVMVYLSEIMRPENWNVIASQLRLEPRDKWVFEGAVESLQGVLDA